MPPFVAPRARLVLASASPRRLSLLRQIGLEPDEVLATEIDESPGKAELPRDYARRIARAKAEATRPERDADERPAFRLAADTVVSVGRRILPKAESLDQARTCLDLLSGRAHRVHTALALLTPAGRLRERLVETRVRFKRLSAPEIEAYLRAGEWRGKAGGYAIQGLAAAFVLDIGGSYASVVGLPLYETSCLLEGEGFPGAGGLARGERPVSEPEPPCPICRRPQVERFRPFCSARCADVDLGRWLTDVYVVPVPPDEDDSIPDPSGQDRDRSL